MEIQIWDQNSANIFHKGAIHVKTDLCDFDWSDKNLVVKFMPALSNILKTILRPCPLKVRSGAWCIALVV
jgi:hypothetical protein